MDLEVVTPWFGHGVDFKSGALSWGLGRAANLCHTNCCIYGGTCIVTVINTQLRLGDHGFGKTMLTSFTDSVAL